MTPDDELVGMVNQIADFFSAYPEAEAVAGVVRHIRDFWDPRMRAKLKHHVAAGGNGLTPLALSAARTMADERNSESGFAPE